MPYAFIHASMTVPDLQRLVYEKNMRDGYKIEWTIAKTGQFPLNLPV